MKVVLKSKLQKYTKTEVTLKFFVREWNNIIDAMILRYVRSMRR